MNPLFVDIWAKYRRNKEDKLIVLIRKAEDVIKSKTKIPTRKQRFNGDSDYLKLTPEQLKINYYDSLTKLFDYEIEFTMLKFPNFLGDYDKVYKALHDFGKLEILYDPHKWYELVDVKKVTASDVTTLKDKLK